MKSADRRFPTKSASTLGFWVSCGRINFAKAQLCVCFKDQFPCQYLIFASFVLTLLTHDYSDSDGLYVFCVSFSYMLDSMSLVPQMYVVYQNIAESGNIGMLTGVFLLLTAISKVW